MTATMTRMVTVKFFRHHTEYVEEFDTVEQAASFLAYGLDAGTLSYTHGEIRDGDRVIAGDELQSLVFDALDRLA